MTALGLNAIIEQAVYSPTNDAAGRSLYMGPKGYPKDGSVVGVIFAHGAGGNEQDTWSGGSANLKNIMQTIAQTRPVVACNFGGDLWGNATSVLQMTDAVAYLRTKFGAHPSKVILMGRSMGHLTIANWARQNKAQVSAIVAMEGVSDLNNIFGQGGGNATSINAAYGGSYSDATYGATYNPNVYAGNGDLNGIPWRNYYASDDTTVPASTITTLAGKINTGTAINLGTGGHSDAPLAALDLPELLSWLNTQAG